jgi:hypothetical protein
VKTPRPYLTAIALIIVAAACSSSHTTRPASPSATTTPRSATELTAEQLDAHLGIGIPAGWSPVDEGDARVFVPNDWYLGPQNHVCSTTAPGMISIGGLPGNSCDTPIPFPTPKQAVALIPSPPTPTDEPSLTIHGYRIYKLCVVGISLVTALELSIDIDPIAHGADGSVRELHDVFEDAAVGLDDAA